MLTTEIKAITDIMGNSILVALTKNSKEAKNIFEDIRRVVTKPEFVIEGKGKTMYYFRMLSLGKNVLVEVKQEGKYLVADNCQINPDKEYIASLMDNSTALKAY